LRCPFCVNEITRVIDSRLAVDGDQVRRRRQCERCGERFTSYEVAELAMPSVVKSDNAREAFSEMKLRGGMLRALEKRPVATENIESSIIHIKKNIRNRATREIASSLLGDIVMDELRKLDAVAYIRFASVYLSFNDLNEFREIINRLEKDP
jgi:transcriptional repressor NrdR